MVQRYRNVHGQSGISAYETGPDHIRVTFRHGGTYEYDYATTGQAHVERMKELAASGAGLATYISKVVKATPPRASRTLTHLWPADSSLPTCPGGLSDVV